MKKTLSLVFLLTAATLMGGGIRAQAQILGSIEADIPFPFYVGGTRLPAGQYTVHQETPISTGLMEITNAKNDTSALFQTMEARSNAPPPNTELVFDHYHNRYFLEKIFDRDDKYGATALGSEYSKMYRPEGEHGDERDVMAVHHAR